MPIKHHISSLSSRSQQKDGGSDKNPEESGRTRDSTSNSSSGVGGGLLGFESLRSGGSSRNNGIGNGGGGGYNTLAEHDDEVSESLNTRYFVRSDGNEQQIYNSSGAVSRSGSVTGTWKESSSEILTMSGEFLDGSSTLASSRRNMNSSKIVFPQRRSSQASETLESLTINKLRFDSLGLYGRKDEIRTLKKCLERMQKQNRHSNVGSSAGSVKSSCDTSSKASSHTGEDEQRQEKAKITVNNNDGIAPNDEQNPDANEFRELVMIDGYSGTGKSALASTLRKPVEKLGGLYVNGKFDFYMRDEPLVGVLNACNQICGAILALQWTDKEKFEEIRDEITAVLGSELGVILRYIPVLEEVLNLDDVIAAKEVETTKGQTNEEGKNQFNFVFRRFIRVVGSAFKPLVMVSFLVCLYLCLFVFECE